MKRNKAKFKPGEILPNGAQIKSICVDKKVEDWYTVLAVYRGEYVVWNMDNRANCQSGFYNPLTGPGFGSAMKEYCRRLG